MFSGERVCRKVLLEVYDCSSSPVDHRHTFHHIHHPLSTHLPPPVRFRKRALSSDRRRKKKHKKRRTSIPPSEFTPTIHEVDEEEAESDGEGQGEVATPTELEDEGLKVDLEKRTSLLTRMA